MKSNTNETFIIADLHVHTPSSSDYKGSQNKYEYIEIIKRYYSEKINIIAFTDHNTIDGYKKFDSERKKIYNSLENAIERNISENNELVVQLREEIKALEFVTVLPGIEIDVRPGIHLIVIFNPSLTIGEIDEIKNKIISDNMRDCSTEDIHLFSKDILDVLDILDKNNCIVIGAHVDSNKGIYNDVKSGSFRAKILSHNCIKALEYNNELTKTKIMAIMKDPQYHRDAPLCYIQSSDYHGEGIVGKYKTYIKLEKNEGYETILKAFSQPEIFLSITPDIEDKNRIEDALRGSKTIFTFDELLNDETLKTTICAILNSKEGKLVFGATMSQNSITFKGITQCEEEFVKILNHVLDEVKSNCNVKRHIIKFQKGDSRWVYMVVFENSFGISFYEGSPYKISNNSVTKANNSDLIVYAKQEVIKRVRSQSIRKTFKIMDLQSKVSLLQLGMIYNADFLSMFDSLKRIADYFNEVSRAQSYSSYSRDLFDGIGANSGNLIVLTNQGFHLESCYLRCSAPVISISHQNLKSMIVESEHILDPSEYIFLTDIGSTHYIEVTQPSIVRTTEYSCKFICLKSQSDTYSTKFILAWMKSSIFYWICEEVNYFEDIFRLNNLLIYDNFDQRFQETIVQKIDTILQLERQFLISVEKGSIDAYNELVNNHNNKVNAISYEIDCLFACYINIDKKIMEYVVKLMQSRKVFSPYSLKGTDINIQLMVDDLV